jgi:hypothetical protein
MLLKDRRKNNSRLQHNSKNGEGLQRREPQEEKHSQRGSAEFERNWRVSCLGGMIVGREAARRMVARVQELSCSPAGAAAAERSPVANSGPGSIFQVAASKKIDRRLRIGSGHPHTTAFGQKRTVAFGVKRGLLRSELTRQIRPSNVEIRANLSLSGDSS